MVTLTGSLWALLMLVMMPVQLRPGVSTLS